MSCPDTLGLALPQVEREVDQGCHLGALERSRQPIQSSHGLLRLAAVEDISAQGVSQLAHDRRGAYAPPGHIADDEVEPPVGEVDRVIPIAADVRAHTGREVAGRQLKASEARQVARQEAALQRDGGLVLSAVEHGVLDRQRGPARQVLGHLEVVRGESPLGLRGHQAERPEGSLASPERNHHRRDQTEVADDLERLIVGRRRGQQLLGDLRMELRHARSNHGGGSNRRIGVGRMTPLKLAGQLDLRRVCVRHRDRPDLSVGQQVDGAPVGQSRDGEGGQPLERRLDVQGLGQQLAGPGEEVQVLAGPLLGGVKPGPIERVRSLLNDRLQEGALVRRESAGVVKAQRYGPEDPSVRPERDNGAGDETGSRFRQAPGNG